MDQSMLARRLALAIAVMAALIGSQGPEFAQQYRQRLGGALEELNRIVAQFDGEVQRRNLSRAEGLKRLMDDSEPLARDRGLDIGEAIDRAQRLNKQIEALNSAGPLMRLYVVATNFDPKTARGTLDARSAAFGLQCRGELSQIEGVAASRRVTVTAQCVIGASPQHSAHHLTARLLAQR